MIEQIKKQFETLDIPVRAKITSNSRKYHKSFDEFHKAYLKHLQESESTEDVGNKEFLTHTQKFSRL